MSDIVYFELNDWSFDYYPDCEPYLTWLDTEVFQFRNKKWLEENKLIVVETYVDMSSNYCITATEDWVKKNCNEILTTHRQFLRYPEEDENVYGQFGCPFLEYSEENIGYWFAGWDEYDNWKPERTND